jgi:hypothetical protein
MHTTLLMAEAQSARLPQPVPAAAGSLSPADDQRIARQAHTGYQGARHFIVLAHLMVLSQSDSTAQASVRVCPIRVARERGRGRPPTVPTIKVDRQSLGRGAVLIEDIIAQADRAVVNDEFRRQVRYRLEEARDAGLVVANNHSVQGHPLISWGLTSDGLHFLRLGARVRADLKRRQQWRHAEDVCEQCSEDELEDWADERESLRNVLACEGSASLSQMGLQTMHRTLERIRQASFTVSPMWAGLVLR